MKKKKLSAFFANEIYFVGSTSSQVPAGVPYRGKRNHVIAVAVVVLHCEWSSDSLLKLIFS